jgi:hypothetical protein
MDEPLSYEASPKKLEPVITNEIVIDHIIESFGAGSQGIICDVHLAIADSHPDGTRSIECKYLAELFARSVDAPKSGEVINLDEVRKLRAKHCRGYPLFMKKYDQPVRDSNSILNKLFLEARRQFFTSREQDFHMQSPQRKSEKNEQDKELQKQVLSSDSQSLPILNNNSTIPKPPKSSNNNDKTSTEQPKPASNKTKETKQKAESTATSSSLTGNTLSRNIVFNGMTNIKNRLKWNQSGNDIYTVDLDTKTSGKNNAGDKLVQLMIDSLKTSSFAADAKLTLVISWGELYFKIPQAMNDAKPENIKDLTQLLKENNNIEFFFKEHDVKTITNERVSIDNAMKKLLFSF